MTPEDRAMRLWAEISDEARPMVPMPWEMIAAVIRAEVEAEREACAKVVGDSAESRRNAMREHHPDPSADLDKIRRRQGVLKLLESSAKYIAAKIRSRGDGRES